MAVFLEPVFGFLVVGERCNRSTQASSFLASLNEDESEFLQHEKVGIMMIRDRRIVTEED